MEPWLAPSKVKTTCSSSASSASSRSSAKRYDSDTTDNTVTVEDVWTFNRNTLDEADQADSRRDEHARRHGRRNERGIFVRGFGRWQVPLRSTAFGSICRPTIGSTSTAS